ncbi:MAG: hypothetical protein EBS72_11045 [Rhizobiales bacterium]|nr:hypothetical protein [Hyphomicrobiales bacterium]
MSQLLLKAHDFWHRKPPSPEPATDGVVPDETADPQGSEKADLLIDDTVQPLVLVAEEPPQLALSGGAVEEGFVGPVLPVSEPQDADQFFPIQFFPIQFFPIQACTGQRDRTAR